MAGGFGVSDEAGGVSVTVSVKVSDSESPTTSKPGPMLAEVDGTRIVNEREAMVEAGGWLWRVQSSRTSVFWVQVVVLSHFHLHRV